MDAAIQERFDRLEKLIQQHILKSQTWLSVQEFAQATGLNAKYVSELVLKNKIRGVRSPKRQGRNYVWRIRSDELERFKLEGQLTD